MVELNLQHLARATPVPALDKRKPIGAFLVELGVITPGQLAKALHLQTRLKAPLGEILVGEGWAAREEVMAALSHQSGLQIADLEQTPADANLCDVMPVGFWLEHNLIPWMRMGPVLLIATARPDLFKKASKALRKKGHSVAPVLADPNQIETNIRRLYERDLARKAAARVRPAHSCRNWTARSRIWPVIALAALGAGCFSLPQLGLALLLGAAILTLCLFMMFRLVGLMTYLLRYEPEPEPEKRPFIRLPTVSIMVPLYKEREIATALVQRLSRVTYPKALLDVVLVLEERDEVTRATLGNVRLPNWIRTVEVPELGKLTTKPRAMNYALDFCRGEILGVWDAEDAPVPNQIETVVRRFAQASEDVVCLQGMLDYYNPRTNWRSRCFTIEYSSWFRVILPGIAKLGLVVPLGGTTFFFKRDKLLKLRGWDAHNVTEDADLGVRLCRAGYRTEIVETTTYEEANFRAWPWVKQRSRWLKGFMVTYLVHMRSPKKLLQELGWRKFLGVQAFFLGTVGQFLLAPVLWVFWLSALGMAHPFETVASPAVLPVFFGLFLLAELTNIAAGALGVVAGQRRFLIPWVPTMILYYPLGVLAAYKGLWELMVKPFFWDKTQHGHASEESPVS
ncbi:MULTISPECIES: glycosyltransferase [unclassified Ruegeria]|uniref:glycosyltransferase n=1 Tax=unclassified Ruegeria TaxID=2625375 RepID=UPI0014884423|nr:MULTISPECIES: glycosyltransferase [unclassified Ruegeria]